MRERSADVDPAWEIRRRRRIMMGKGEAKHASGPPAQPGTLPPPPLGPAHHVEFVGITSLRALLQSGAGIPRGGPFALFGIRVLAGLIWLVNGVVKNPFNEWGYFPEWTQKFAENSPIPPYKWFLENVVLPYIEFWGWVQFLLEVGLGVMLILGLLTGLTGLVATAWAVNIFTGSVFVPNEWVWGLLAFVSIMALCWTTRAGRFFGLDAKLRPRLLADERPAKRWIAKWTM